MQPQSNGVKKEIKKTNKKQKPIIKVDDTMILVLDKLSQLEERLEKVEGRMGL
mgnify:CR=1 FL=1